MNIAACIPVDIGGLPEPRAAVAQTDDTIGRCARCTREVWVGPRKRQVAAAGLAVIMCMPCAVTVAGPAAPVLDLHPDRPDRPRTGHA